MARKVNIWPTRRERVSRRLEIDYIRANDRVFRVRGRINRKSGRDHIALQDVLTGEEFLGFAEEFGYAAQRTKRIEVLNEMEVLAWMSS